MVVTLGSSRVVKHACTLLQLDPLFHLRFRKGDRKKVALAGGYTMAKIMGYSLLVLHFYFISIFL